MADQLALRWVFLACGLVLALISSLSTVGASRLLQMAHSEKVLEAAQVIRAELMHRDHRDSPLSPPEGTICMADRLAASARRDEARIARRLGEADFSTVLNASSAEFTMALYFGTPAQKFTMIVDTGSDLVWLQCLPCSTCFPEPDPYFNTSASSTYSTVPFNDSSRCDPLVFGTPPPTSDTKGNCHISYSYVDLSAISGTLSTETVAVSNSSVGFPNFLFGCMNNDTGSYGSVDGLAGFGRGFISLPRQFSDSSSFDLFAYCLLPYTASATATSPLLFGYSYTGLDRLVFTPMLTYDLTSYYVNMTGISINGTDVGIPSTSFEYNFTTGDSGVIFDSGTTYLTFKRNIYTKVAETLQGLITYPTVSIQDLSGYLCFNTSGVRNPTYPSMSLQFAAADGTSIVDYLLATENIFLPYSDTVDCLAIGVLDGINQNFVGNVAQGNHYIVYDVVDAKIGWVSRDCTIPL